MTTSGNRIGNTNSKGEGQVDIIHAGGVRVWVPIIRAGGVAGVVISVAVRESGSLPCWGQVGDPVAQVLEVFWADR